MPGEILEKGLPEPCSGSTRQCALRQRLVGVLTREPVGAAQSPGQFRTAEWLAVMKDSLAVTIDRNARLPMASVQDRQRRFPVSRRRQGVPDCVESDIDGGDVQAAQPGSPAQVLDGCGAGDRHSKTLRGPTFSLRYVIKCSLLDREGRRLTGLQARLLFPFRGRQVPRQDKAVHHDVGAVQPEHDAPRARCSLPQCFPYRVDA